jgi:hypothetical protein
MGKAGLENREKAGEMAEAAGNYLGYDSE